MRRRYLHAFYIDIHRQPVYKQARVLLQPVCALRPRRNQISVGWQVCACSAPAEAPPKQRDVLHSKIQPGHSFSRRTQRKPIVTKIIRIPINGEAHNTIISLKKYDVRRGSEQVVMRTVPANTFFFFFCLTVFAALLFPRILRGLAMIGCLHVRH